MESNKLRQKLGTVAFAFRGYNVTNLGRTSELLRHEIYGPTVRYWLNRASQAATEILGRDVDLVDRVEREEDTTLQQYGDAIALIVATELAQLQLLREHYEIDYSKSQLSFGYSLGEIATLVGSGVIELEDALKITLSLSADCIELAQDVTLAVFFSRRRALPLDTLRRLCVEINAEGSGVIGISTYLSPNSVLLMGQGDTIDRFRRRMRDSFPDRVYLRKNEHQWPPMHTPIMWQRNVPNRAAVLMHTCQGGLSQPHPPLLSMVTGKVSYNDYNAREILHRWVDHPQRLWDVVYESLSMGTEAIVHVGPAPNIIPATYFRLKANVEAQLKSHFGMRALSGIIRRPWLANLLPVRTALLRAPFIEHVILEDWLLSKTPKPAASR